MAIVQYDLVLDVREELKATSITEDNKNALFQKPSIETSKAKKQPTIAREVAEVAPEEEFFSLEDISEGYSEMISKAEDLLKVLRGRVGDGLTYTFDPAQLPILAEAVSNTFVGESSRITFAQYVACLRLDSELATAIGEQSIGNN